MDRADFERWLADMGDSGILDLSETDGDGQVHIIGKLNRDIYKNITDDIMTDEVVITDERIAHIEEGHPGDYIRYGKYISEIIADPDYIVEANKSNTAVVLKEISGDKFMLILRMKVASDPVNYGNSIISFWDIGEKTWEKAINNKRILYKKG